MRRELPPDVLAIAEEYVASGAYQSVADVLYAALNELDAQRRRADRTEIEAGMADLDAGRHRPIEEFDAEFRAKHNLPPQQ